MGLSALLAALDEDASEVGQAIALLTAAGVEDPERLSVGEGDRRLLAFCRTVTRSELDVVAACAACGELSEAVLSPDAVPSTSPRSAPLGTGGGLREPTYGDLRALPADPDDGVRELLARCVVGVPTRAPQPSDLELVDDSLSGPIVISCTSCGEPIAVDVDVHLAALERLARHAQEIDQEVHLLARTYHWSLQEIESLGDERRRTLASLAAESG
ncbi:MAG: hypothetical protein ABR569_00350 [Gaiellaceae bacterium]